MIRKTIPFVFALMFLAASNTFSQTHKPTLLNFKDLQKYDGRTTTFRIQGYVFDIYKCPPCPPGAMCKPCIPDNITITDKIDLKNISLMKRLRIYTEKIDQFTPKKRYIFTVKIKGNVQTGSAIDSVDLIRFDKLRL